MNFTNLTSGGSGTNATSYETASVTPISGVIILAAIETDIGAGEPTVPTLSGLGVLWTMIEDCYYDQTGTTYRLTVFASSSVSQTPTTGKITIDYDGVAQGGCTWIFDQAHITESSSLIVQWQRTGQPGSSATSVTVGLSDALEEGNSVWACASWVAQETGSVSNNWTILANPNHASPVASLISAYKERDTSVTFSWTTSAPKGAIIVEIRGSETMPLHASQDDWKLRADGDTERSAGALFVFQYYLTDTLGNYLTDESGNRLVAETSDTLYPQVLHALQDDFKLNAEESW